MNIKLFGYEIRAEIAIACILIGMFMGLIMFCDCFEYSIIEGMTPSPSATAPSTTTHSATAPSAAARSAPLPLPPLT